MRRRNQSAVSAWLVIVAVLIFFLLAWQFAGYRSSQRRMRGFTIAGQSIEGLGREGAIAAVEAAFAQPVHLTYQEQVLSLTPESVEFRLDTDATFAALDEALAARGGLDGFIAYLLRRWPGTVDVPVVATYSEPRLHGYLARIAQQYDHPPQPPAPLPDTLSFQPGRPGYELDVEASRPLVVAALLSAVNREAELVVRVEDMPSRDLDLLGGLLLAHLADFDGIAGIFVKDLQTGDELAINGDVAFSGMGVMRLPVVVETYRLLDQPPDAGLTSLVTGTLTQDDHRYANQLLQFLGNQDAYLGAETLTHSMHRLGLVNTFMATPYDVETTPPTIVTPANSRTDVHTRPDLHMQTTPTDIGLLLEMVYQCSQGGGALTAAYPGDFTASKCSQMLEWMSQNRIDSLIEAGVPPETRVAHRQGWVGTTHADAGIVFTPGGDFVLAIFLYNPVWLEWEQSAPLIADIATATYNYFNPAP